MNIKDLNVSETNLKIEGVLEYNGNHAEINKVGEIQKSNVDKKNYIFDFDEERNSGSELSLVFASMKKDISENELYTNKKLENEDVLQLAFFNNKTNDLVLFEVSTSSIQGDTFKLLQNISANKLDTSKTDSWAHKILKPSKLESTNNTIAHNSLVSTETAHAEVDYTVRADYEFPIGITSHYATANTFSSLQYPLSEFEVDALFEITDMWVEDALGETTRGWSNWSAGNKYSDGDGSISTYIETHKEEDDTPDYIRNLHWSSNGMSYKSNSALDLAIDIFAGKLGGTLKSIKGEATYDQLIPVYKGGKDYPQKVNYKFNNSEINEENSHYYTVYGIRHAGDYPGRPFSHVKKISVRFNVPWHIIHADETLEVPSGIDLYYISK